MAGLFNIPQRGGRENDQAIAKKVNQKPAPSRKTSRGGVIELINSIKSMVDKNLSQFKDDYLVIRDEDAFESYIDKCIENDEISIDTETTGLDPMQDKIVGLNIYTPHEKAAYVPLNHISYITGEKLSNQLGIDFVRNQLNRLVTNDTKVIMFNADFDIRVIRNQIGSYLNCYWDCYLAARLLNENEGPGNNGLKALHKKYVLDDQGDAFSFDALFHGVSFDKIPIDIAYLYAAHDALITYELYDFQRPYLTPTHPECIRRNLVDVANVFHNIEMPCVEVVCDMEDNGIAFDLEYNKELSVKYNKLLEEKTQAFYKECEVYNDVIDRYRSEHFDCKLENPINISSPTQIAILLYDIIGVGVVDQKSPRGTGVSILEKIDLPIAKAILEYREMSKLITAFIDKLPESVNPNDGKIHCKFNQYGADTGRFSCSNPNLQQIPSHNKDIRKMFVADKGYVLMSSDYSQQEVKVMAQMCGDPGMLKAFREGKDFYAEIASVSFNKPYEECLEFRPDGTTNKEGKNRRSQAKSILLGINYGRGVASIAEQLGCDVEKAQSIKDSVFNGFPAIPKFERDSMEMAKQYGYVTTLWGRKRRLPDLQLPTYEFKWLDSSKSIDPLDFDSQEEVEVPEYLVKKYLAKLNNSYSNHKRGIFEEANAEGIWIIDNSKKIADAQRQCVNARIQGSAADMSKLAMIKVGTDRRLAELGFRLLIPVHDELIGECPIENAKICAERFAELMADAAYDKLTIPIKCDVEVTREWYGDKVEV